MHFVEFQIQTSKKLQKFKLECLIFQKHKISKNFEMISLPNIWTLPNENSVLGKAKILVELIDNYYHKCLTIVL